MNDRISLKELERKAFRSTHQDGLWDLFLGGLLLLFGLGQLLERAAGLSEKVVIAIYMLLMLILVGAFTLLKRKVTLPRIGRAKFGLNRRIRVLKVNLVLAASVGLGLVVFLLTASGVLPGASRLSVPALFLVNCVIVFSAMGYYLDLSRLYLYGWFYGLSIFLSEWLRPVTTYPLFLAVLPFVAVMVTIGGVLFVRFRRDYPLTEPETAGTAG
jgi:hypothetical protein